MHSSLNFRVTGLPMSLELDAVDGLFHFVAHLSGLFYFKTFVLMISGTI